MRNINISRLGICTWGCCSNTPHTCTSLSALLNELRRLSLPILSFRSQHLSFARAIPFPLTWPLYFLPRLARVRTSLHRCQVVFPSHGWSLVEPVDGYICPVPSVKVLCFFVVQLGLRYYMKPMCGLISWQPYGWLNLCYRSGGLPSKCCLGVVIYPSWIPPQIWLWGSTLELNNLVHHIHYISYLAIGLFVKMRFYRRYYHTWKATLQV